MDIFSYAKALDTVGWFLGKGGWPLVVPLLVKKMEERGSLGMGFFMHDGSYYQIRLDGSPMQDLRA